MQIGEALRLVVAEPLEVPKIPTGESYNQRGTEPELKPEPVSAEQMRAPDFLSPLVVCSV